MLKPAKLTFEEAVVVPLAAITALQGLRVQVRIQPQQKVLINCSLLSSGIDVMYPQTAIKEPLQLPWRGR